MDVSKLLSESPSATAANSSSTSRTMLPSSSSLHNKSSTQLPHNQIEMKPLHPSTSPQASGNKSQPPKVVAFPLILSQDMQQQARLPLRVNVNPHDTTDSIISTVKNFYGLYDGQGISFEDSNGASLIPCYDNLSAHASVQVRLKQDNTLQNNTHTNFFNPAASPSKPLSDGYQAMAGAPNFSLPDSKVSKKRSISPSSRIGQLEGQSRSSSATRGRENRSRELMIDIEAARAMSDDDGASVSVSSSRKARNDHQTSAEISLDNIVEGNRRKGVKFESSVLPLFVPPQMPQPASATSASPAKQMINTKNASPGFNYKAATANNAFPSPQSFGQPDGHGLSGGYGPAPNSGYKPRARASRTSGVRENNTLPTPDPTIHSTISDEDVALQLMRLGDASHTLGRTSTSTLDETLSGIAEHASSDDHSGDEYADESVSGFSSVHGHSAGPPHKKHKTMKTSKASPMSATFQASRKNSNASTARPHQDLATDEEDLSAKPRCQRCRKSKKGCDRQRPCQRCKDAGIGIEGCVSEEEGNGRKGRYGRHMGVVVKKGNSEDHGVDKSPQVGTFVKPEVLSHTISAQEKEKLKKRKR